MIQSQQRIRSGYDDDDSNFVCFQFVLSSIETHNNNQLKIIKNKSSKR